MAQRDSSGYSCPWTLRDGTKITIRSIRPDDEALLAEFHRTLSDRTVYSRYFSSMTLARRIAHERLDRICHADAVHEVVLVAEREDPRTGHASILGVGRFNRLLVESHAEVAVLVSDHYQQQGLGTELLRRLVEIARDQKLKRLVAEMQRENLAIQIVFKRLGFQMRQLDDLTSVMATLDLEAAPRRGALTAPLRHLLFQIH